MNKVPISLLVVLSTLGLPATAETMLIQPMLMPPARMVPLKPLMAPSSVKVQSVKSKKTVGQQTQKTESKDIFHGQIQFNNRQIELQLELKNKDVFAFPSSPIEVKDVFASPASTEVSVVNESDCTCQQAEALYEKGKYKEAAFYYNKTAETMLRQYGHENSDIANIRYSQALCYYMMGNYAQADKWLTASLDMYKRVKDKSNSIALTMAVLGDSKNRQNHYQIGDKFIKDAIAMLQHKKQQKSSDYEYCVSLLASSYDWQNRQEEALPLHRQSLALQKQLKVDPADIKATQRQIEEDMKAIEQKQSLLKKSTA